MDKNSKKQKLSGGMEFLLAVILLYLVVALFDISFMKDALTGFLSMALKIFPLLFVVFLVMIAINLYFTKERTRRYLGEGSGTKGWLYAIISGILVSGPPYVLYPLLGDLKKRGLKNSLLAVFLYNRNVKIPFLPVMVYYFGLNFTIIVSALIILFSILNGWIVGLVKEKNKSPNKTSS